MSEQSKIDSERARLVDAMCMTWRHDFGLDKRADELGSCGMTDAERDSLRRQMGQLYDHHIAPLMQARASLPVGVPDGLIDELRNHAAARTGYTTDLIGRAADAIEKMLEPIADRWASHKEKFCGCKDASRLNQCRGLDNCELPCGHPDRKTAAPTVKAEPQSIEVLGETCIDGGTCHHTCTSRCFRRECCAHFSDYKGPWKYEAEPSPSLPAAGSAGEEVEVVAYLSEKFIFGEHYSAARLTFDRPYTTDRNVEPLMTVAQHNRIVAALSAQQSARQPELTVWEGPMPESNGKSNFTAVLMRKGADLFDGVAGGMTIARSEYPDRVRYEADCVRWLIGELDKEPCITDYDADKHSGYVAQQSSPERSAVEAIEWLDDFVARCNGDDRGSCESVNILRRALYDRQSGGEQLRAALKAGQGEAVACAAVVKRMADAEPYLGDKVHYGCDPADDYKAYRVELYIPTPASAPEPFEVAAAKWLSAVPPASADAVSVPRELLRQGADLLDAHSSGPSIEQNIADDFRTLLASHGRGEA